MSREHELARWFADRDEATAAPLRAEIERQRQYIAELEDLHCFKELRADNERLRTALQRIDGINDNPACYNPMIEEVLRAALEPKP